MMSQGVEVVVVGSFHLHSTRGSTGARLRLKCESIRTKVFNADHFEQTRREWCSLVHFEARNMVSAALSAAAASVTECHGSCQ